jgi:ubiquitin
LQQTKKPAALKQKATATIEDYLALKKAEFDDIDKFQLDEISYSIEDERSVDSSLGQSDAVNREIIEVSSAIGSIFDSISIDASSKLMDDMRTPKN